MSGIGSELLKYCDSRPAFRRSALVARVADRCGVSQRTVYRWMAGETSPTPDQLRLLAWAIQRPMRALVPCEEAEKSGANGGEAGGSHGRP